MFWTHTINEGQSKKRFFSLSLYMYKCLSRDWKTMDHLFCAIKYSSTFIKRIFLFSHLSNIYIFFHYMNILHTCLLIHHICIYLYTKRFLRSLWQLNSQQKSVNEHQWYRIACLTGSYVIIICLHIVCPTYFIFFCIHKYIWQGEETICFTISLRLCQSHQWEHFIYMRMPH
jgi:hypothetical protein